MHNLLQPIENLMENIFPVQAPDKFTDSNKENVILF